MCRTRWVGVLLLCHPLYGVLHLIPPRHYAVFTVVGHNGVDDVERVPETLAVWVRVIDAHHQNDLHLLAFILGGQFPGWQTDDHISLRHVLRFGFLQLAVRLFRLRILLHGVRLRFNVRTRSDRQVLGEYPDLPLHTCGIFQGFPLEKLFQVRHHGVLQKFLCHPALPP